MTDSFAIRQARPDDLQALPVIERAAAAIFRTTLYAYLADDDLVSAEVDLAQEYVWVVVDQDDHPIAFAIVHLLDASVHLHELDVHLTTLSPGLQAVRQAEAEAGLPMAQRICMQLDL